MNWAGVSGDDHVLGKSHRFGDRLTILDHALDVELQSLMHIGLLLFGGVAGGDAAG